ncbi:protein clustered with n-succinyl arginine/lysine racemase [hydrocarbon metagenome]|uniref:Protein clustered with n-succinyl arginine/lysine racemase n=1 Tax=hydrocarbon metagenome TaxID=938273 RepID=A0A0W8E1Y0_9ZZZZ
MKILAREVIEQGQITVRSDLKLQPFIIRVLGINDLMAVLQLQSNVMAAMDKKELYVPIPEHELQFILEGHGESLGLFIHDELYAACSLLFDVDYENNMARELDFSDEELSLVAQLELSLVHLDLRGNKLQHKLAGILAERAEERKKSRYIFTTASPFNYPSIQTLTSLGLYIARLSKMYYDWDRYIVYKDFTKPTRLDLTSSITLPNTSFVEQQHLLNNGYRGYSQFRDKDGIKIMFAKTI